MDSTRRSHALRHRIGAPGYPFMQGRSESCGPRPEHVRTCRRSITFREELA